MKEKITAKLIKIAKNWQQSRFDGYILKMIFEDIHSQEQYTCWFSSKSVLANKESINPNFKGKVNESQGIKQGMMYTNLVLSQFKTVSESNRRDTNNKKLLDPFASEFTEFTKITNTIN